MDDRVDPVAEDQIHSLAVVRSILPWRDLLASNFGTTHPNASLQLIDVVIVMLAGFFNPLVRSQRLLDALSSQQWMQERTGVQRIARSTLSDALKRLDGQALRPLIDQLVKRIPALHRRDPDLAAVTRQILAADGTYFNLPGEVAWALQNRRGNTERKQSRIRLNLQLDIESFTPVDGDFSGRDDASEPEAFRRRLRPGVIYLLDRNFHPHRFLNTLLDIGSSFVLRLRKNVGFTVQRCLPLSARDAECGVLRDEIGTLAGPRSAGNGDCRSCTDKPPGQPLRRVTIRDEKNQCEVVRLSDLLDVPAYVIAALYRNRWQIKLFFKWLKCCACFDHAVSHHPGGLTLQFYVAILATLLLHLHTRRRVSKYALFWLGSVASGRATFGQMRAGLARIEREKELERARRRRKRLAAKPQV